MMHARRMLMTSRLHAGSVSHNGASSSLAHSLLSLLSCMRCISCREDAFCELLHEVQHNGATSKIMGELLTLIDELPAEDYIDDLHALRDMLGVSGTASRNGRARRKTPRTSVMKQQRARAGYRAEPADGRHARRKVARKNTSGKTRRKPSR